MKAKIRNIQKKSSQAGTISQKSIPQQTTTFPRAPPLQRSVITSPCNPSSKRLPNSPSSKKIEAAHINSISKKQIDHQSRSNSNMSQQQYSENIFMMDRIVQLREKLKNMHLFYKACIEQQKDKSTHRNEVFMGIVEQMQRSHNNQVKQLHKMIEEADGDKKDVGLVDERMNEIKGSIDDILKQSSDLKQSNQMLEKDINEKESVLHEKQEELSKLKEELMEARNQLEGFQRLNLKENKRNKQIVVMMDKTQRGYSR